GPAHRDVHGDGAAREPAPRRDRRTVRGAGGARAGGGGAAGGNRVPGTPYRLTRVSIPERALTHPAHSRRNARMATFMRPYESQTYALLRIVAGFLFLWHGMQKLFSFPSAMPPGVPAFIIWIGGPIELFGGILIMIGLFTRWAAFLASGM